MVVTAGVHRASSIKVAEAAKVIENTQRDLNIALMNELALIFHRIGIDTMEVLKAAGTKWNFLPFRPGLVGGHCIGVDPYYLTHKADMLGYHPQVILAGRRINDGMGHYVAEQTVKQMIQAGGHVKDCDVIVLGLTFKENCPDLRNSRVIDIIRELESYGCRVSVHDPLADAAEAMHEYGVTLRSWDELPRAQAIVAAVAHDAFKRRPLDDYVSKLQPGGLYVDVKSPGRRGAVPVARPRGLALVTLPQRAAVARAGGAASHLRAAALCSLLVVLAAGSPAGFAQASASIPRVKLSIVAIGTFQATRVPQFRFAGTGFVVGDGTLVATNAHVLPAVLEPGRGSGGAGGDASHRGSVASRSAPACHAGRGRRSTTSPC